MRTIVKKAGTVSGGRTSFVVVFFLLLLFVLAGPMTSSCITLHTQTRVCATQHPSITRIVDAHKHRRKERKKEREKSDITVRESEKERNSWNSVHVCT